MLADSFGRTDDFGLVAIPNHKVNFHVGVAGNCVFQQFGQSRTIAGDVVFGDSGIFEFADGRISPGIICGAENQDYVGRTKVEDAGVEGTVGEILA